MRIVTSASSRRQSALIRALSALSGERERLAGDLPRLVGRPIASFRFAEPRHPEREPHRGEAGGEATGAVPPVALRPRKGPRDWLATARRSAEKGRSGSGWSRSGRWVGGIAARTPARTRIRHSARARLSLRGCGGGRPAGGAAGVGLVRLGTERVTQEDERISLHVIGPAPHGLAR